MLADVTDFDVQNIFGIFTQEIPNCICVLCILLSTGLLVNIDVQYSVFDVWSMASLMLVHELKINNI